MGKAEIIGIGDLEIMGGDGRWRRDREWWEGGGIWIGDFKFDFNGY